MSKEKKVYNAQIALFRYLKLAYGRFYNVTRERYLRERLDAALNEVIHA